LVNYWLERQPPYNQTADLWQTRQQPITAVKDSLQLFLAYLQEADTNDRVGLAVYTAADGTAKLESPLTADYQQVEDISRQRQAGHYDRYTNIGAGIQKAREELERNGRPSSKRMILLMTDGIANRPNNTTDAKAFVRAQAQLAADSGLPIVTVSLGAGADKPLMQEVADMTAGVHFNIPGGQSVAEYEEDLKNVFREVAADRPLKLVK
ncbi:MAG: VWA domain-containing protein, partial [Pirellulales bacterium]|nr:VWA domain-containing protein [Pirellulales bacterium]